MYRIRAAETGKPLVDLIVDAASQKGTGKWTVQTALDLAVPVTAIGEATFARGASSEPAQRAAGQALAGNASALVIESDEARAAFIEDVRQALFASKIVAYSQGFDEIEAGAKEYEWGIDKGALARIWRAGCIIRAAFLDDITRAYEADRADTAWNQQMQEKQRQDSLTQQRYENEASERAYQDALKQQAFNNSVTSEKLNIAKGEWALKQSNAQAKASRAAGNAAAKSSGSGKASGSTAGTNALKGSSVVPFTAALLRSRGKSDTSIANALQKEGYTTSEIAKILQQMNQ